MQYLLLIFTDESVYSAMTPDESASFTERHMVFRRDVEAAGAYIAAQRLQPVSTAKSLVIRGDKQLLSDGPFAETKEQLGGFYLIDVASPEEALEWARQIPQTSATTIEIRPILEM